MGISMNEIADALGRFADGVGELVVDGGNAAIDLATGYNLAERGRVRDAQAAGNEERDGIYGTQAELRGRFTGDWDARQFVEESFDSMSHRQIMDSVNRMDPAAVTASAHGWTAIGTALADGLHGFTTAILGEIKDGWEGAAADRALDATARYVRVSDELATAGSLVGTKVAEAATGITQVKATVPPPAQTSVAEVLVHQFSPGTALIKSLLHDRNEAHEQAIQIMKTVYSPVMRQADSQVPVLPAPPTVAQPEVAGPTGAGGGSANPTAADSAVSAGFGPPGRDAPSGPGAVPGADAGDTGPSGGPGPAGAERGSGRDGSAESVPAQSDPSSPWTRPAGVDAAGGAGVPGNPAASGAGAMSGAGGPSGSGPGGLGSGGLGSGGLGTGGLGSGGLGTGAVAAGGNGVSGGAAGSGSGGYGGGAGLVGIPGGAVGTTAGAAGGGGGAAGAGAGAPGRPGMPGAGMIPAAARGRGEDDTEHATPGYLVTVDNGNDLVGSLPLVAPPVLGG
ncbi:hypothetical protein ACFWPA_08700 [Rhodococcus sp. NPDC058505]|uniref:PPE domain-containing protein n=1 Tax=Rhodococcus sp. NPDC058505 TaxID=3346531 RepID=UPI003661452F